MNDNELELLDDMLLHVYYTLRDDPECYTLDQRDAYASLTLKRSGGTLTSDEPILGFKDDYRWLSNFWFAPVTVGGHTFEFNEKWYMAHKTLNPDEAALIMATTKPGECKRVGRTVTLRPDWEEIKDGVMLNGLRLKFKQNKELRAKLLATGHRYLEETNTWGDTYWGVCDGVGRNMLGHLLMQVRSELTVP